MVRIGVKLPASFSDPGEYLADARALEAAGADSVWLSAVPGGLDPLLLLAAIAAVTSRAGLGLLSPSLDLGAIQDELTTLRRLSRSRVRLGLIEADGVRVGEERWREVPVPADRAAWRASLAEAESAGIAGVLVAMDPRLLDLLRHPDEEEDRSDLILSQG